MENTRVTRSLRPGAPGTLKLRMQHGPALVCVRYRQNLSGTLRYTTIELIVDRRPTDAAPVQVAIAWREHDLRAAARAAGAFWDAENRVWILTLAQARRLKLLNRATPLAHTRPIHRLP